MGLKDKLWVEFEKDSTVEITVYRLEEELNRKRQRKLEEFEQKKNWVSL